MEKAKRTATSPIKKASDKRNKQSGPIKDKKYNKFVIGLHNAVRFNGSIPVTSDRIMKRAEKDVELVRLMSSYLFNHNRQYSIKTKKLRQWCYCYFINWII